MSVSIHIEAIIPVDGDLFSKQQAVCDACEAAGVQIPAETVAFFDLEGEGREVTAQGIRVDIGKYSQYKAVEGDVMYGDGAIVDLTKLPAGTTRIRVYAS